MSKPQVNYKRYVLPAFVLLCILLSLIIFSAAENPEKAPAQIPQTQAFTTGANQFKYENTEAFKEAGTPILMLMGMTINKTTNLPYTFVTSKNNTAIKSLASVLLQLFIPFYALMILVSGTYYVWAGYSHVSRARAKNMILRLIVGMVLCGVSLQLFDSLIYFENWIVQTILVKSNVPMDWGPFVDMPGWGTLGTGSLLGLIVATLFGFGGCAVCLLAPTWCTIFSLFIMPYIILALRNSLVITFGILFPLMIFLLSFRFTKGLGTYLLKMALTWIFLPVPMAVFIALSYNIANAPGAGFIETFTAFACWVMVAGAPMYMTSLMGIAGGVFVHAGRTMTDTRMVTLGYFLMSRDPTAIIQGAYHNEQVMSRSSPQSDVAKDQQSRLENPKAEKPPWYRPWERRMGRIGGEGGQGTWLPGGLGVYDAKGVWDSDISLGERAKRAFFGREEDLSTLRPEDQAKYMSPWARHRRGFEDAMSRGQFGRAAGHSLAALGSQMTAPIMAAAGTTIAGLVKNMVEPWGIGQSLLNVSRKMTGQWELVKDTEGKDRVVYRHGVYSLKTLGSEIKEATQQAYKAFEGTSPLDRGAPPSVKAGLKTALGVSLAAALFAPMTGGASIALLAAGGGLGAAGITRYFKPRRDEAGGTLPTPTPPPSSTPPSPAPSPTPPPSSTPPEKEAKAGGVWRGVKSFGRDFRKGFVVGGLAGAPFLGLGAPITGVVGGLAYAFGKSIIGPKEKEAPGKPTEKAKPSRTDQRVSGYLNNLFSAEAAATGDKSLGVELKGGRYVSNRALSQDNANNLLRGAGVELKGGKLMRGTAELSQDETSNLFRTEQFRGVEFRNGELVRSEVVTGDRIAGAHQTVDNQRLESRRNHLNDLLEGEAKIKGRSFDRDRDGVVVEGGTLKLGTQEIGGKKMTIADMRIAEASRTVSKDRAKLEGLGSEGGNISGLSFQAMGKTFLGGRGNVLDKKAHDKIKSSEAKSDGMLGRFGYSQLNYDRKIVGKWAGKDNELSARFTEAPMSVAETKDYLKSHDVSNDQRRLMSEGLLGRTLDDGEWEAVLTAHEKPGAIDEGDRGKNIAKGMGLMRAFTSINEEAGMERGDARAKARQEVQTLMDAGIVGERQPAGQGESTAGEVRPAKAGERHGPSPAQAAGGKVTEEAKQVKPQEKVVEKDEGRTDQEEEEGMGDHSLADNERKADKARRKGEKGK